MENSDKFVSQWVQFCVGNLGCFWEVQLTEEEIKALRENPSKNALIPEVSYDPNNEDMGGEIVLRLNGRVVHKQLIATANAKKLFDEINASKAKIENKE
jgi:hypothetical protein